MAFMPLNALPKHTWSINYGCSPPSFRAISIMGIILIRKSDNVSCIDIRYLDLAWVFWHWYSLQEYLSKESFLFTKTSSGFLTILSGFGFTLSTFSIIIKINNFFSLLWLPESFFLLPWQIVDHPHRGSQTIPETISKKSQGRDA